MKNFTYLLVFILVSSICVPVFADDSIYVWSSDNLSPEAVTTSFVVR